MDCRTADKMIIRYIQRELSPGEDIQIGTGMEQEIRASYQHLRTVRFFRIVHYAVNTLVVLSLILTAMLQFRILYIH